MLILRKSCVRSALPADDKTASSASSKSDIMKIIPTQRVESPAIRAIILSFFITKETMVQIMPMMNATYKGI